MERTLHQAHPWHGIPVNDQTPHVVNVFVEIVPSDTIKYEVDKETGHLKVDRPQTYSNICPTIYGFIPQTYCGAEIAERCEQATGRTQIKGDGDPLDICVLSEKHLPHGNLLLEAIPIGGLRMIDNTEADDKIIAVLKGDALYGNWLDLKECPELLIHRLKHYFLTYKNKLDETKPVCEIPEIYDRQEALAVIQASYNDYLQLFPH